MRMHGIPSWPRRSDRQSMTSRRIFCERLICVHDNNVERGWWHDLEHVDELLFADGGRIVESSLEKLHARVEESVELGYRPIIFVGGMYNWGPAMEALGRHQAFGGVYVLGRDDEEMSSLLHNPSPEIKSVTRNGGQLIVPTLEYGQVLDGYLNARLEDFHLTEFNAGDPLKPVLKLVCRFNPFRYMDVTMYCRNGIASISQKYRVANVSNKAGEPCNIPVRFQEWLLDFTEFNPFSTANIHGGQTTFMKAFTETFELPQAYLGWEPDREPPWIILKNQLNQMSRGVMAYLNKAQQELLALLDKDLIAQSLESFGQSISGARPVPVRVRGVSNANRDGTQAHGADTVFVILKRRSDEGPDGLVFDVIWLSKNMPETKPDVILDKSSEIAASKRLSFEWNDNLSTLTITGIENRDIQLGWVWSAEDNVLKISLASSGTSR